MTRAFEWQRALLAVALSLCAACATTKEYDYAQYLDHMPASILVLPPLDQTPEVDASCGYLATVTRELAERGYYVFPVAIVDRMMRDNGMPTPGEMHQVPLDKLREIFDADAVLYLNVKQWGTSYQVLDSATTVQVEGRLVDTRSGIELWHGEKLARQSSSDGNQGGLVGMLAGALINQVMSSALDPTPAVAHQANGLLFADPHDGLLLGARHTNFEQDQKARRAAASKSESVAAASGASAKPAP